MDDAGSQSPERVRTSADNPGNDHLSENAGQNTSVFECLSGASLSEPHTSESNGEIFI